jgi:hypothetical protein
MSFIRSISLGGVLVYEIIILNLSMVQNSGDYSNYMANISTCVLSLLVQLPSCGAALRIIAIYLGRGSIRKTLTWSLESCKDVASLWHL